METAAFISSETGTDLIVSFAIPQDEPRDIVSLTLIRTPKYESLLAPANREVNISRDDVVETDNDMLRALRWEDGTVTMSTSEGRRYKIDVRDVENDEILEAQRILREMNVDGSFELDIIESDG